MSKSVFVKAWLNDLDIADAVESIRMESDIEKGLLVELRVKNSKALDLANHKDVVAGAKLEYQFGFIGLLHSSVHVSKVSNIDIDFTASGVSLQLKALDKGIEMKKGSSSKIWSNVTLSDIAKEIAANYGLEARIEPTKKLYHSLPQGGQSDWQFLRWLVMREAGAFQLHVSDYALYLERNLRSKDSRRTFVYGENIISFSTQVKEVTQKQQITPRASINDKTGKIESEGAIINQFGFSYSIKDSSATEYTKRGVTEWETKDGQFSLDELSRTTYKKGRVFGVEKSQEVNQVKLSNFLNNNGEFVGAQTTYVPTNDILEAQTLAKKANEVIKRKVLTASLQIELDPSLSTGEVVTIQLPVQKMSGNWFIEKVVHKIDYSGAFTELSLNKNGTSKPIKVTPAKNEGKINNTEGATSTKPTTVKVWNNNGVEGTHIDYEATLKKNNFTQ